MDSLNKWTRYVAITGIFLMPLIVFIVTKFHYFPFITGKNFSFRVLAEIIFFAWLIVALGVSEFRPKFSWILAAVAGLVTWMIIPNIFGPNPTKSFWSNFERMEGWVTLIHLLAYFVATAAILNTQKLWRWFWNISIIASVIIAGYGMMQLAGKIPINQGSSRLDATLGNAAYLAGYMLFHIFLTAFFLIRHRKERAWLVFYCAAILLQTITLYYTATRGAILGLIGGVVLTTFLIGLFSENRSLVRKLSTVLIVALIGLGGIFFAFKDSAFVQDSQTLNRLANISLEDKTTKSRIIMWGVASKGFLERPILGWGQENFSYVFNKNYDPVLYNQEQWFDRAHNIFFEWLVTGGALGLILYLSILLAAILAIWKMPESNVEEKAILTGLVAAYSFHNFFVFDQIVNYILFFSFLAFLHTAVARPFKSLQDKSLESGLRDRVLVPLCVILMVLVPWAVNAKPFNQSRTLIRAIQVGATSDGKFIPFYKDGGVAKNIELFKEILVGKYASAVGKTEAREQLAQIFPYIASVNKNPELQAEFEGFTRSQVEAQLQETPEDARNHVLFGSFLSRIGDHERAQEILLRAHELSPRKQPILLELAQVELRLGNREKVVEYAKQAYELEPENDSAWRAYVISAMVTGDTALYQKLMEEARSAGRYDRVIGIFETEFERNPKNPELRLTLAALYHEAGRTEDARKTIEELIKDYPTFEKQGRALLEQLGE